MVATINRVDVVGTNTGFFICGSYCRLALSWQNIVATINRVAIVGTNTGFLICGVDFYCCILLVGRQKIVAIING